MSIFLFYFGFAVTDVISCSAYFFSFFCGCSPVKQQSKNFFDWIACTHKFITREMRGCKLQKKKNKKKSYHSIKYTTGGHNVVLHSWNRCVSAYDNSVFAFKNPQKSQIRILTRNKREKCWNFSLNKLEKRNRILRKKGDCL